MSKVDTVGPLLVDIEQAGKMVRLGRSKLYQLIREGSIPVVHIGRAVRIPVEGLQRYVDRLVTEQENGE